jgi:GDP-4-dehydro-6-deoxy-D-mannose reductase
VSRSWKNPWETLGNNIRGQLNLLEGLVRLGLSPKTLIVGSGEEYGMVRPEELPIKETNPLRPYSPYAVSKVTQDLMGYQYFISHRLPIIRVRPFNHIGPRQSEGFVAADFAKQIAEVKAGLRPAVIKVGNLEARRDFTDVRDMVRAYYLALLKGEPGEVYNIGSGVAHSIEELLQALLEESAMKLKVEKDPELMRPSDVPVVVSDATKFRERTTWTPTIGFRESLSDILNWWHARVKEGL